MMDAAIEACIRCIRCIIFFSVRLTLRKACGATAKLPLRKSNKRSYYSCGISLTVIPSYCGF